MCHHSRGNHYRAGRGTDGIYQPGERSLPWRPDRQHHRNGRGRNITIHLSVEQRLNRQGCFEPGSRNLLGCCDRQRRLQLYGKQYFSDTAGQRLKCLSNIKYESKLRRRNNRFSDRHRSGRHGSIQLPVEQRADDSGGHRSHRRHPLCDGNRCQRLFSPGNRAAGRPDRTDSHDNCQHKRALLRRNQWFSYSYSHRRIRNLFLQLEHHTCTDQCHSNRS